MRAPGAGLVAARPSTYMLMLAGLGAIGMVARRRAGKSAAFAVQGA